MKLIVQTPHVSHYPEPISFKAGAQVTTGRRDEEFPGWIWCRLETGAEGWAPEQFLRFTDRDKAVALEEYTAKELNTREGESLETIRELNAWIWCRNNDGEEGWVPEKTLKHDSSTP